MRIILFMTLASLGIVGVPAVVVAQQTQQSGVKPAAAQATVSVSPAVIETTVNTAVGFGALESNTTGAQNAALGSYALNYNSSGYRNTASGYVVLYANTTGDNNTASGSFALNANTTGLLNTASGAEANPASPFRFSRRGRWVSSPTM